MIFGDATTTDIDTGSLGTAGCRINGAAPRDLFGSSSAALGDLNGDRRAEITPSAPGAQTAGESAGAVYVVFGKPDAKPISLSKQGSTAYDIAAPAPDEGSLGSVLATLGDVDGDSVSELAVGGGGGMATSHSVFVLDPKPRL